MNQGKKMQMVNCSAVVWSPSPFWQNLSGPLGIIERHRAMILQVRLLGLSWFNAYPRLSCKRLCH